MDTFRVFLRWAESLDAVTQGLHNKVTAPSLDPEDDVRETMLDADRAEKALSYLNRFEYASVRHVLMAYLWHTMGRRSAVRALDLKDYNSTEQYVELQHRPDTDTPLKNGGQGERFVALSERLCTIIDDYLKHQRPDVVDDYGREPLLATDFGRPAASTIQQYVYQTTRPCWYGEPCPEERDPDTCEAAATNGASKCPASESPHAIRRGSITHSLREGIPKPVVGDRASVSERVLDQHYDQRSAKEKMERRRDQLDKF
jgi:integrase